MKCSIFNYKVQDYILEIGGHFPLLEKYSSTEQDPSWHAEGNVEIHTDMVLDEARSYSLQNDLTDSEQRILLLACLFHDYGKPLTTKEVDIKGVKHIGAPGHEVKGASLLYYADAPKYCSQTEWMKVVDLVANHHLPKTLAKRGDRNNYYEIYRSVECLKLLVALEICDMKGRICDDRDEQVGYIELFEHELQEYGLLEGKDPYWELDALIDFYFPELDDQRKDWLHKQVCSRYEDGQFFSFEEELMRAFNYIEDQSHLVVLIGLPGSGKSTLSQEYASQGYTVISMDQIRESRFGSADNQSNNDLVVNIAHQELRKCLREKKNVVWDATNFRRDFRSKIAQRGFDYVAFVEFIWVREPSSGSWSRNLGRDRSVDKEAFEYMVEAFQAPSLSECHYLKTTDAL